MILWLLLSYLEFGAHELYLVVRCSDSTAFTVIKSQAWENAEGYWLYEKLIIPIGGNA